ncbi:MAG: hypothetical protein Q7K28_01225, partial [Candidatus Wildermuthbacteria bacterium]|nr:hypothetical protein [Candidatus Wildermuthbacteria bacterium]
MSLAKNKKNLFFLFILFLFAGLAYVQPAFAVVKEIGETTPISITCSDADGNLSGCNITSPIT